MTGDPSPLLVSAIDRLPAGQALDLACGEGRHAIFLAQRGWKVTAVDLAQAAIDRLLERAGPDLAIDARVADLESGAFRIAPDAYDLICDFCYLQHSLFPQIRGGVRPGGLFVATIHMFDSAPQVRPMNPAYLLQPGELRAEFAGWDIFLYDETKTAADRRQVAQLVARRPL